MQHYKLRLLNKFYVTVLILWVGPGINCSAIFGEIGKFEQSRKIGNLVEKFS